MPTETNPSPTTPKYEIVPTEYLTIVGENGRGTKVYHTRALRDFETVQGEPVKIGDYGPFIENISNLSRDINMSWGDPSVILMGTAKVKDNAFVGGHVYANSGTLDGNIVFRASGAGTPALLVKSENAEMSQSYPPIRFISLNPTTSKPMGVSDVPGIPLNRTPGHGPGTPPAPGA